MCHCYKSVLAHSSRGEPRPLSRRATSSNSIQMDYDQAETTKPDGIIPLPKHNGWSLKLGLETLLLAGTLAVCRYLYSAIGDDASAETLT